jgi:hypothetical protein
MNTDKCEAKEKRHSCRFKAICDHTDPLRNELGSRLAKQKPKMLHAAKS